MGLVVVLVAPLGGAPPALAAAGEISTVVGGGNPPDGVGDGLAATSAALRAPWGVDEVSGELFISENVGRRVRKVNSGGVIGPFAGGGALPLGDGGLATAATLQEPDQLTFDADGNLFIVDNNNDRVRKVDVATGVITTVAGGGSPADGVGDGGLATDAALPDPHGVAFDDAGNLYVSSGNRIRKIDQATGIITTVAGNGNFNFSGDGGLAIEAELGGPTGIAFDGEGDLFIAEGAFSEGHLRRVDHTTGIITTVAGGGGPPDGLGDGGHPTAASLQTPLALVFDADGNLLIAAVGDRVRRITPGADGLVHGDPDEVITTIAGGGSPPDGLGDGGPATSARIRVPRGVSVNAAGDVFISGSRDEGGHIRVRKVDHTTGIITTVAGNGTRGFSGDGGPATAAQLNLPRGLAFDSSDNLFLADAGNNRVRKVDASTGIITTVAGGGVGDGLLATAAALDAPRGVTTDASGNVFIADCGNGRVRKVDSSNVISTHAGGSLPFNCPSGLHVVTSGPAVGTLYVADAGSHRVLRVSPTGAVTTVAGTGAAGFGGDGGAAAGAQLNTPSGVHLDAGGNILVADSANNRVRRVDAATGTITTVAGDGSFAIGTDGVAATATSVAGPTDIIDDGSGNLIIAESGFHRIRRVSPAGIITTISGNGIPSFAGDGGPATSALLNFPTQLDSDAASNLFLTDRANGRARRIEGVTFPPAPEPPVRPPGRQPVRKCGQVVTQNTRLQRDIGPCPGDGLIIGADGIKLDLNGHRVFGTEGATESVGIRLTGRTAVTITGARAGLPAGSVSGFDAGVVIVGGSNNTVQNLQVRDNIGILSADEATYGDGIGVFFSSDNRILNNTVHNSGIYDGIGILGISSHRNLVQGNVVTQTLNHEELGPVGLGIIVNPFLSDNLPREQSVFGNRIINNTVRDNDNSGISTLSNVDGVITGNVVENNGRAPTSSPPTNGIGVQNLQLAEPFTNALVQDNQVRGNGGLGVDVLSNGNQIVDNEVTGNQGQAGIRVRSDENHVLRNQVHGNVRAGILLFNGATTNEVRDNDASNNKVVPGSPVFADLSDLNPDCDANTWFGNIWGSGGFFPVTPVACTTTGGHPAAGASASSTAAVASAEAPADDVQQRGAPEYSDLRRGHPPNPR